LPDLPEGLLLEQSVRAAWERHGVHERALAHRADAARSFVFYEECVIALFDITRDAEAQ
jgi:hypothetical protein